MENIENTTEERVENAITSFLARQESDKTRRNYELILRKWQSWVLQNWPSGWLTPTWPQKYQDYLLSHGISNNTINHYMTVIGTFYNKMTTIDLKWNKLKGQPRRVDVLSDQEIKQMLVTAKLELRAVIMFLLDTGVRVQELVELSKRPINTEQPLPKSLVITGKGGRQRTIVLSDATWKLLRFTSESGYLFGKRLTVSGLQYALRSLARKLGWDRTLHPHLLRHKFATTMLEDGANLVDVQAMLGHSSIATTQIYTHVSDERLKQVWDRHFQKRGLNDNFEAIGGEGEEQV